MEVRRLYLEQSPCQHSTRQNLRDGRKKFGKRVRSQCHCNRCPHINDIQSHSPLCPSETGGTEVLRALFWHWYYVFGSISLALCTKGRTRSQKWAKFIGFHLNPQSSQGPSFQRASSFIPGVPWRPSWGWQKHIPGASFGCLGSLFLGCCAHSRISHVHLGFIDGEREREKGEGGGRRQLAKPLLEAAILLCPYPEVPLASKKIKRPFVLLSLLLLALWLLGK